jgi:SNF2 family DNA or RNA helicase
VTEGRLFPYQAEGVRALLLHPSLLLADDMGLGKTIQTIAALNELDEAGALEHSLVVVPASLIAQWRVQLSEWGPGLEFSTVRGVASDRAWQWRVPAKVHLVSYETLRSDFTVNPHSPVARLWDVVIFDEAQRAKNRDTDVARVCKQLRRRRSWALTGTPLENNLDELASVMELVQPWSGDGKPRTFKPDAPLLEYHRSLQLRRRKRDVLPDLPPKVIVPVRIELSREQRRSYDQAEQEGIFELKARGQKLRIEHILELITRLKQICNFCPRTGESAKADDLVQRLTELVGQGHRALVFSQFADSQFGAARIAAGLQKFRPLQFTGSQRVDERELIIRRFKGSEDSKTLVLSLRAGGQGLNLQEASYVFHFDRWWNPAVERQAEDRSHRIGQQNSVTVYTYTCSNTIEERIDAILKEKQELFDEIVDGTSIDASSGLSRRELLKLVGIDEDPGARV